MLPDLIRAGVKAIKIEGRQRSSAYIDQVTRVWRQAIDRAMASLETYEASPVGQQALQRLSEGRQTTLGALSRPWQ